jgi:hypothetical protein
MSEREPEYPQTTNRAKTIAEIRRLEILAGAKLDQFREILLGDIKKMSTRTRNDLAQTAKKLSNMAHQRIRQTMPSPDPGEVFLSLIYEFAIYGFSDLVDRLADRAREEEKKALLDG